METETLALYQSVLLDHARNPRNHGRLWSKDVKSRAENPMCGDDVTIYASVMQAKEGPPILETVQFKGAGCSICMASASILTTRVTGKTLPECSRILSAFDSMMENGVTPESEELLDEGTSLAVVREFPQRLRCARLAWEAFADALEKLSQKLGLPNQ